MNGVLLPMVAMVALTFVVMFLMAYRRISTMQRERIHPQKVATSAQMSAAIADTRASDNFRNLFELPVLFYAACLTAQITGYVGSLVVALAWLFVALRVAHSAIHCSYNNVNHRFAAFLLGALVLLALWCVLAAGLIA